jgi:hypothetical protein
MRGHVGSDRFSPVAAKSLKGSNGGSTEGEAFSIGKNLTIEKDDWTG